MFLKMDSEETKKDKWIISKILGKLDKTLEEKSKEKSCCCCGPKVTSEGCCTPKKKD